MARKYKDGDNFDTEYGGLYENELDELAKSTHNDQLASYKPLNIDTENTVIKNKSKTFVNSIVKMYYKFNDEIEGLYYNEEDKAEENMLKEIVASIANIEADNLDILLKQVKWSSHLVETLMRRLETGGNMDPDLIEQIMKAQQSALNLTLTISSHVRNIPTFFKHLQNDIMNNGNSVMDNMLPIHESGGMLQLAEASEVHEAISEPSEFDIAKPQRGMKDLIAQVNKAKAEARKEHGDEIDFEDIKND
ncbi:gp89 [Sphingomonas phage PAU]|uniref:gp89 n=1 Tax=Sphingomonas phage PAU TaxID=1150991 RepID=UPI00025731E3|nr:gp89 [Sphingomonas phage PAU]AFF28087.1 gp89 [Sphingomonas phage PAU]